MGTTLTGTTPANTYDSLIKVTDNGPLSGTAKYLSDGLGNDSALALSTSNIGIGTNNPTSVLDVVSSGTGVAEFEGPANATVNFKGVGYVEGLIRCGGEFTIGSTNNFPISFLTNNSEKMRITSAGNVGIGTSSPNYKLDVLSNDADWAARIKNTSATGYGLFVEGSENSGQYILGLYNGLEYKMVVTGAGNVGIGTTSPSTKLHIYNGEAIVGSGTDGVKISYSAGNSSGIIDTAFSDNNLEFRTNGTTKMWIANGGNVGIGTSSPQQKLHIAGVAANSYALLGTSTNWGAADTNRIKIGSTGDTFTLGCDLRANTNYAGTTETSLGLWVTNGSSTMVEVVRATQNGLTFNGDTAAANALDDYEEGTWTMGVSFGGASVGVTYSNNTGTYTKIGRQVTVTGYLSLTSKGTSTGSAFITGLPFTILPSNSAYSIASIRFTNVTFANQFQAEGVVNNTTIEMTEITEAGVVSALDNTDFANNSTLIVSLTYFV